MENQEISARIQMERLIPVEIFRKKRNTFRGITFFPFLPKRPKFSVSFVWITSAMQALCPEKTKTLPVFCKWYNPIPFLFSVSKTYQYHLTEIFHRNFRANGKRSWTSGVPPRKFYTRHKIEALVWKVSRKRKSWTSDKTTFFIKQINKCEKDVGFPKPCSQCSHQQILQICVRSEWTTSEWKKNFENTREKKLYQERESSVCSLVHRRADRIVILPQGTTDILLLQVLQLSDKVVVFFL